MTTEPQENEPLREHLEANPEDASPILIATPASTTSKASTSPYAKPCDLCHTPRDILIRCQIDETRKWHFVCTGKCWKNVSGGKVDGGGDFPWYRYGGMWKNKHEGVSAKIKGKAKERNRERNREKEETG